MLLSGMTSNGLDDWRRLERMGLSGSGRWCFMLDSMGWVCIEREIIRGWTAANESGMTVLTP